MKLPWILISFFFVAELCLAHDGPDPIIRWRFDQSSITPVAPGTQLESLLGPNGKTIGQSRYLADEQGGCLFFSGGECGLELASDISDLKFKLPTDAVTVSFWGSVDRPERWGGLASIVQDNGNDEAGWVFGYDQEVFTFGLASQNGGGRMTYLAGKTKYELGRIYHVVAVYDGESMQLYVNGKLDAESKLQTGPIRYPRSAPLMIGAYRDANEFYGHRGRVREIAIYDVAAKPKWVSEAFEHQAELTDKKAEIIYDPLALEIEPYLQFGTQTSMTIMCKTNRPASSRIKWGETNECLETVSLNPPGLVHEHRLENLQPETQYFYRIQSQVEGTDQKIESDVFTFQTAVNPTTPFAFAVISDTQGNPEVAGQLAKHAWGQRPNFLLHPGDLVSTGPNDSHWTQHFFPSMHPLISRVPFYPVLGNHEQNAKNYFDYVSLPAPEYFYSFTFGNSEFFMIDSNRKVGPESEQYQWLEKKLARSPANWKIVCHHHPPYSSDENDYGNLWKINKGTQGDLRVRKLVELYERHHVDIVWNGHIHSYERTWPVRGGKAVDSDAPFYMITGGGGGGLETPGPIRPFFQNTVRYGHHYSMVRINGNRLELQVYDLENRLFDSLSIRKTHSSTDSE